MARGSWRRSTASRRAEKEANRTRSRAWASRTVCRAAWTTQESLRSMLNFIAGWAYRASSSRTKPRPSPESRSASSAHMTSPTVRGSFAVRRRSSSWLSTTTPSAVSRRSVSIHSSPSAATCSTALQVFSGTSRPPPRWAMTAGRRARDAAGGTVGLPQLQLVVSSTALCCLSQPHGSTVDSSAVSSLVRTSKCR